MTSPPCPIARAALSVITPFEVDTIAIPSPPRTLGNSSFDLVKEFRGKFVAFFWQSFASLFGYNLKVQYDPLGEDKDIELIVLMIENGTI